MTLSDDRNDGLSIIRSDPDSVLVPFRENVTITCKSPGRYLRNTASSGFRQCVYDPKQVSRKSLHLMFARYFLQFSDFLCCYFLHSRVCQTTGCQDLSLVAPERSVALLSQPQEPNTDSLSILNIKAHSSLVAKTHSNWQDKPASTTML